MKLNKITELWKLKREYNTLYVQINLFILCFPPSFPGEWMVSDCEELVGVSHRRLWGWFCKLKFEQFCNHLVIKKFTEMSN